MAMAVIDWLEHWLAQETEDPVLHPPAGRVLTDAFHAPPPDTGTALSSVLDELTGSLLPACRKNAHPGFMAYVSASADPVGALADLIASTLNQNVTSWRSAPGATTIERQTLCWLDQLVGFSGGGHGSFVSGGSAANFQAVALAIDRAAREHGITDRRRLCVYWSDETHLSMPRAARVLGIDPAHVQVHPFGQDCAPAVGQQMESDRSAGLVPALICATAGTAGTGRIEPVRELADLARQHGAWLHVDGAYGAPAAMLPEHAALAHGMGAADSLSIDPHKWLFAPLDIGCLLVRDPEATRRTFAEHADYTQVTQTDTVESFAFFDHSLELSRRFRALKLWMIFKVRGVAAIRQAIQRNIDLRKRLDTAIEAHPKLELLASGLSISCFRYCASPQGNLDALNARILDELNRRGAFHLSPNRVDGQFALRICIVNLNTEAAHVDQLVEDVVSIGDAMRGDQSD